jgi:hypothetical protein
MNLLYHFNAFNINRIVIFFIYVFSSFCFPILLMGQENAGQKKLIEFGWDYPTVSFLKNNISKMQNTPFDGVVFSLDFDIYNAFDTTQRSHLQFQYEDLSEIQWENFTDNFLFVRGAGYSGAHWLSDKSWEKIVKNLKRVSKALAISKAKGIGFDPEYYYKDSTLNPWVYRASWYKGLSYRQVGNYVRKRGKQFIQALETNKPDVKILCFWLLGLVSMQNQLHPIAETGMALYPFFVEGMLEGKNKTSEIIDGNEYSYGYQTSASFVESGKYQRTNGAKLIKESLTSKIQNVSLAHAVFFDLIYATSTVYENGYDNKTKQCWLRNNLYNAFKTTDKYVWFYNEKINWWKGQVPSGVAEIIKDVKTQINIERNNTNLEVSGKSSTFDFKQREQDNYHGFHYTYGKKSNELNIKLLDKNITSLEVYSNSRLIYSVNNPAWKFAINLNTKYNKKDNLIIMSKDNEGKASVAYVN